jgi:hypothetical protein
MYPNSPRPVVSKVSASPPAVIETETKDAIEEEILESVPKTMKNKAELLALVCRQVVSF